MASIRETPPRGGPAGTQRTLPASGNLSAEPRNLPVGEVLAARVVAGEAGQDLLLELAGQRVSLPNRLDLPPGSVLSVRVERSGEGLRLTQMSLEPPPDLPPVVAEALRQALPRQASLAALLPLLARLTGAPLRLDPAVPAVPDDTGSRLAAATESPDTPARAPPAAATTGRGLGSTGGATPDLPPADPPEIAGGARDGGPSRSSIHPGPAAGTGAPGALGSDPRLPRLETLLGAARPRPASAGTIDMQPLPAAAIAAHLLEERSTRPASRGITPFANPTVPPAARPGAEFTSGGGTRAASSDGGARLAALASNLPAHVAAALRALAEQVPAIADLRDGGRLARFVERAGLMLEARLAAEPAPSRAEIAADLKAALLRVRASVDGPGQPHPGADMPGAADSPAEQGRTTLLKALGESVDGTLARMGVNQLQIATTVDTAPLAFSFEIPLRDRDGHYHPLGFEFEREAEDPSRQRSATSTVTLRMAPPGLGPLAAVLRLCGEHLVTELWAEAPTTRALLHEAREGLAARLRGAGLEVTAIRLIGQPPPGPQPPAGLTASLIETEV